MKLPYEKTDLTTSLAEFDIWITPSLSEIRDSDMFANTLASVIEILEILGKATDKFTNPVDPDTVTKIFLSDISGKAPGEAIQKLLSLTSLLYLVTGKSDNNVKCQFPVYLRNDLGWSSLPRISRRKSTVTIKEGGLPRELEAETYMEIVAHVTNKKRRETLLNEFIKFILKDKTSIDQLTSVGRAYFALIDPKDPGAVQSLLAPLVIFQVRGSVTASGGHEPEDILRQRLEEWGLERDVDFNSSDALEREAAKTRSKDTKTRAYDFIIPFNTIGWEQRIFIQCQFYAGDSGSVSHKNVDQTDASRSTVLSSNPNARFVEYVDGAGYSASLNGDLKKLLQKDTTASFFQVRSAPIRLRRELQEIGFLTPLEVEHAVLRTDGSLKAVTDLLLQEGYESTEIKRCISRCLERNIIVMQNKVLGIVANRRNVVRRYFLLDTVARSGSLLQKEQVGMRQNLIVPGYGPCRGMTLKGLRQAALQLAPSLKADWLDAKAFLADVDWLHLQGLAIIW